MNRIVRAIWTLAFAAALPLSAAAQGAAAGTGGAYQWVPARLIPNEFGLPNGTWTDSSVRDCIRKCSADKNCTGFSVQKAFGDSFNAGCKDGLCDKKTECHAKGAYGAGKLWTPTDAEIRVPRVDPKSNAWIAGWGSVVKK